MTNRARIILGTMLLAAQIGAIAWARFTPNRYLCWAPYDAISLYALEVTVAGRKLEPGEVEKRYRLPSFGRENRSIHHVVEAVSQYERTYGRGDGAEARLVYRTNGGPEKEWRWSPSGT